jgi:hypothetical protein
MRQRALVRPTDDHGALSDFKSCAIVVDMHFQQVNISTVLSPVFPAGSLLSLASLISTVSALAPIALISLLLRSQRK